MSQSRRRRHGPKPDRRRALELLAASPDGCTEALMFANGFTAELLVELVRAGLASATSERVAASGRSIEIVRVRITEAGRQALATATLNRKHRFSTIHFCSHTNRVFNLARRRAAPHGAFAG